MLLITSEVELSTDPQVPGEFDLADTAGNVWQEPGGGLEINVGRVDGVKCARCWRYVRSVSTDAEVEGLCERCIGSLSETVGAN